MLKSKVNFKGTKEGIILQIDDKLDFVSIKKLVTKKLDKAKNFFVGAHVIGVTGKELTLEEENELSKIIESMAGMKVLTLEPYEERKPEPIPESRPIVVEDDNELNDEIKEDDSAFPFEDEEDIIEKIVVKKTHTEEDDLEETKSNADTVFHRGTMRSGRRIESNGNIVVLGDVNPGAELLAKGNIVVMGALKGFAHAGLDGESDAFVTANKLRPTQLRIGTVISRPPDDGFEDVGYPEIAFVKDGHIIIEPNV